MAKILYVEDEPFLGKIVKESLESRGFTVSMIDHGSKVIDAYTRFSPDLCILDVMLPGQDGFTLSRAIRDQNKSIPILFLTAKDQIHDLLKGFKSGGNDYMKKPFSMEELIVRINNLLELTNHSIEDQYQDLYSFGIFHFDFGVLELVYGDQVVKLSFREGELLKMLLDAGKKTIDRKIILQNIWGDDHYFNSRNLDVYIRKLRKHLLPDLTVQILTLKGVGYRFIY